MRVAVALLAALAASCATSSTAAIPDARAQISERIAVEAGDKGAVGDVDTVRRDLPAALAILDCYGLAITRAVVVTHGTLEAFIRATHQAEYTLRAWTTFDRVDLAPLSSWNKRSDDNVSARLAHELCHAAVYQAFGSQERAKSARVARFFFEGACSVVAGQGDERLPLVDVVTRARLDPIAASHPFDAALFHDNPALAYAIAHHAMAWVVAHADTDAPHVFARVIRAAADDGAPGCVERALAKETGLDVDALWRAVVDSAHTKT